MYCCDTYLWLHPSNLSCFLSGHPRHSPKMVIFTRYKLWRRFDIRQRWWFLRVTNCGAVYTFGSPSSYCLSEIEGQVAIVYYYLCDWCGAKERSGKISQFCLSIPFSKYLWLIVRFPLEDSRWNYFNKEYYQQQSELPRLALFSMLICAHLIKRGRCMNTPRGGCFMFESLWVDMKHVVTKIGDARCWWYQRQ